MSRFALQTFTIRKFLKTPAAIESGFARISELGLNAVELAYINLQADEIDAVERACKASNISVGSTQITFDFLDKNRDWVLKFHQQLNCKLTSVSVLPLRVIRGKRDSMLQFAERLDALGQYYRERGLQLCFHHHDFEFRHYGAEPGLDLLLANTSADNVGLELDTYWVARGGRSPQDMISDLNGRVKVVHLRDFRLRWKRFTLGPVDCELGQGNLDFRRIVDSCLQQGVEYMAIEQATSTPFESVATSVAHLKHLGYATHF
jgi:sugar phosphate isomerase/epimerase